MSRAKPFHAERYQLRAAAPGLPALLLVPIARLAAGDLGRAFAGIDPWASYPYPADVLAAYFAASEPSAPRYSIDIGGTVAGVVGLRLDWLRGPYLQFLGLLPGYQRLGLGGTVLAWIEAEAGPASRNLWVCASDFNAAAIRFYEHQGFQRIATLDGLVKDGRDEVLLRKKLT